MSPPGSTPNPTLLSKLWDPDPFLQPHPRGQNPFPISRLNPLLAQFHPKFTLQNPTRRWHFLPKPATFQARTHLVTGTHPRDT